MTLQNVDPRNGSDSELTFLSADLIRRRSNLDKVGNRIEQSLGFSLQT